MLTRATAQKCTPSQKQYHSEKMLSFYRDFTQAILQSPKNEGVGI